MQRIDSTKNQQVKKWKKLLKRKGRKQFKQYLIEGEHLIEEALKAGAPIREIVYSEEFEGINLTDISESVEKYIVSKEVAKEISDTETTQGIFALMNQKEEKRPEKIEGPYLFLDAVQDPGNVGTMIRSADAAGFKGVVLGNGTVDAYNSKTIRSAQGSHFHVNIYEGLIEEWIGLFKKEGYPVYGTALDENAETYTGIHHSSPFALIVGNEGAGVRKNILDQTDKNLYIPIKGNAESLNVAIAASILMFSIYQ